MNNSNISEKTGKWLLKDAEDAFKKYLVPKVPSYIETYHLTYMTLIWSIAVLCCFYFGKVNQFYLWIVPVFVILQYLTDILDGAVGKFRNTGLVKWGYYADHFLDYIFLTAIIFGYGFIVGHTTHLFIIFFLSSAFMVHVFLIAGTGIGFTFSFSKIGPTEGRLIFIITHLFFVYMGLDIIVTLLPYIVIIQVCMLLYLFVSAQKKLWRIDMKDKQNSI